MKPFQPLAFALALALVLPLASHAEVSTTSLLTTAQAPGVMPADGDTLAVQISEDGSREFVVSRATNLLGGSGGFAHIYYRISGGPWQRINGTDGTPNGDTQPDFSITRDGRRIAFVSSASNLIVGDTNGVRDVFVHDLQTGVTQRASLASNGQQASGNAEYRNPVVSEDGTLACFVTDNPQVASDPTSTGLRVVTRSFTANQNFVTPGTHDADRCRIWPNSQGIVFEADASASSTVRQIWGRDLLAQNPTVLSVTPGGLPGNGSSTRPVVVGTGSGTLIYSSYASDLVAGDTNGAQDAFRRTVASTTTVRVSLASNGGQLTGDSLALAASGDGTGIAIRSTVPDVVFGRGRVPRLYLRDATTLTPIATPEVIGWTPSDDLDSASVAGGPNPDVVLFTSRDVGLSADRTRAVADAFRVRPGLSTVLVTEGPMQAPADPPATDGDSLLPALANGGATAYYASASQLVANDTNGRRDLFLYRARSPLLLVTRIGGSSADGDTFDVRAPSITPDASSIAFRTTAALVAADTNGVSDVYVWHSVANTFELVSVGTGGASARGDSFMPDITPDGRYVTFASAANDLVANDGNGLTDVFVRDLTAGVTTRASVGEFDQQADGHSTDPSISDDGRFVAFCTHASGLAGVVTPGEPAVVLKDRGAGAVTRISPFDVDTCRFDLDGAARFVAYSVENGARLLDRTTSQSRQIFTMTGAPENTVALRLAPSGAWGLLRPTRGAPFHVFSSDSGVPVPLRMVPTPPPSWVFNFESAGVAPNDRGVVFDHALPLLAGDHNALVYDIYYQPDPTLLFRDGFE